MEEKEYLAKIANREDITWILTRMGEIGKEIESGLDDSRAFREKEYKTACKFLNLPHDENPGANITVQQLTYFILGYRSGWIDSVKCFHDKLSHVKKKTER